MRRLTPAPRRAMHGQPREHFYPLQGGEDLISPPSKADPGTLRYSLNYECDESGKYRRIDGYTAFDGTVTPQSVPGSGSILGVWVYNGVTYAFRNAADGLTAKMYKSSVSGWVQCDLGRTVTFTSGGTTELSEGDVITGITSAATATVKKVHLISGAWANGDAAGVLVLYSQTGTFQSENVSISGFPNIATLPGNSTAVTLLPSGRYEFLNHNFYGSSSFFRMYGCDGVNKAFEWDGATFVQITTGMPLDAPTHIAAFKMHLFFSFPGGSLQHSSTGEPTRVTAVTGAAKIGIGDDITALMVVPGGTLAVLSRNSTNLLSGTSVDDWVISALSDKAGAKEWTAQMLGAGIYLDDRGLTSLATVQEFGDFSMNVIAEKVAPFIESKKNQVQSSVVIKGKSQYRLYFDDLYGLCVTFKNNRVVGATRLLYDRLPVCCAGGEDANGNEILFFGSTDGFVYRLDSGTSFNGSPISAIARTHYNFLGSPSNIKRFRRILPELEGPDNAQVYAMASYSYGVDESQRHLLTISTGSGIIGVSTIGGFRLGAVAIRSSPVHLVGGGTNIALAFSSETAEATPHVLQGITLHYDIRGSKR